MPALTRTVPTFRGGTPRPTCKVLLQVIPAFLSGDRHAPLHRAYARIRPRDRREFLRIGGLASLGAGIGSLLGTPALAKAAASVDAAALPKFLTDKSVIFVFCHGGPSQYETFDPKLSAPSSIRSVTGECQTVVPGMTFGGTFTKLARVADRVSIVRSYQSQRQRPQHPPLVGKETLGANLGSWYSRIAGTNRAHNACRPMRRCFPVPSILTLVRIKKVWEVRLVSTFGASYAPFIVGGGGRCKKTWSSSSRARDSMIAAPCSANLTAYERFIKKAERVRKNFRDQRSMRFSAVSPARLI